MKILVTGGAGFIGSHVADAFCVEGHEVHVMDDLSTGRRENVPEDAVFHQMDIRSDEASSVMALECFDVLCHHAAQMDVRRSVADPRFDADVNVRGFLNLVEAGLNNDLKKVLFSSTGGAIYGEPDYAPQDEQHPLRPLSPYGITKLCTEKYLYYYHQQYGLDYVVLRYANVYGPRQNPHGEAGVVAIFTEKLLRGEQPVINGDGLQTRDYIYVGDVVRANIAGLHYDNTGIFNVGTSVETDVNQLFSVLRDLTAPGIPEQHGPGMPGEQRRSILSFEHSHEVFGWSPKVDLQTGLAETVDWFRNRSSAPVR